ncbi:MAG TPA: pyridoxal phosphate-dependent aminotransferase [Bacteroidales bacterium]|nr:pyridoxal phosphate-dependent aminotransferase [Bacteroidales bacterium]HOU98971.1 pyridoxal phosphate-dependent aminotransferase [Bacteroidales bacterium]
MDLLADRVKALSESQTLAMTQKSRELKAQGIDVINLSIGEPDFTVPQHIKEAAKKAIDDNYSYYPPVAGYEDLRKAIVAKFKRDNNLEFKTEQIVVSNGAKHSIMNVILSLVNAGDEVIIPAPYWVSYIEMIRLARGKAVVIDSSIENDFKVTPEQIENAITEKTKIFLYSSPSNPTGSLYTKDELKAFAQVFARHKQVMVVSDEIYEHINFVGHHESIAQFDEIKDQVVVVNGVSKGYAMPGYRIGYLAAPSWLAKAIIKIQGQMTSSPSSIAQMAALAGLVNDNSTIYAMRDVFKHRRDLILSLLKEVPDMKTNVPEGAFYVFADIRSYIGRTNGDITIHDDNELCLYLLNDAHVALVGGAAFGAPGYIRFSYATSDENIIESVKRIKASLGKLF